MTHFSAPPLLALLAALGCILTAVAAAPCAKPSNPAELGEVRWGRDLDQALADSKGTGKPVLLLFQEIPGCDGCVAFGREPLAHPLLVEAIEDLFVPVMIRNNQPGAERKVLERYGEPASNFPVMRFLDGAGKDIIERQDNVFTVHQVARRMIEALATAGRDVPEYLKTVMLENFPWGDHRERLTFAVHCFWEGEVKLGAIDGVIATRAAFYNEREVVDVVFDPTIISIADLCAAADKAQCADTVYAHGDVQLVHVRDVLGDRAEAAKGLTRPAPISDQQHALTQSPMRFLPLTSMQAMKINAAVGLQADAKGWLSPRQAALLAKIDATLLRNPKALDGLTRPESADKLIKYTEELEARLKWLDGVAPPYDARMTLDLDVPRLLAYELWANHEALESLRKAGANAPQRGVQIMAHITAASRLWLTRLTGEKVKVEVWPASTIQRMSDELEWLKSAWSKWLSAPTPAKLDDTVAYVNSKGELWSSTARDILTHLMLHSSYHRGQIATLLGQAGQGAAVTDYIHAVRQGLV